MRELLWAQGRVCRNFCGLREGYAGAFLDSRSGMTELLWAHGGGVYRDLCGLRGGMPELLAAQGGVCRNFCGLKGRYAGNFVGSGGGYAGTIVGLGGGMPELLWA